jgi:hypothetical protein
MPRDGSDAIDLHISSTEKLIELGFYEMTLRKVD